MLNEGLDLFIKKTCSILNEVNHKEITNLADYIYNCYDKNKFVFIAGNGGSGSNASHFCEDLGKCTLSKDDLNYGNKRLKVISLTDNTPYILAWGNDEGFDRIFSEQLKNISSPGDLFIAISGSGNSPNIINAVKWANNNGLKTFGCTGFDGGELMKTANQIFHVKSYDMGIVESIHLIAFHWVVYNLYKRFHN